MSISPRQIWERLSPERQEQIIDELMTIFEEVIYEQLRISHNPTPDAQSNHLYSSVESPSNEMELHTIRARLTAGILNKGRN